MDQCVGVHALPAALVQQQPSWGQQLWCLSQTRFIDLGSLALPRPTLKGFQGYQGGKSNSSSIYSSMFSSLLHTLKIMNVHPFPSLARGKTRFNIEKQHILEVHGRDRSGLGLEIGQHPRTLSSSRKRSGLGSHSCSPAISSPVPPGLQILCVKTQVGNVPGDCSSALSLRLQ